MLVNRSIECRDAAPALKKLGGGGGGGVGHCDTFFSSSKKLSQFPRHGVGVSLYIISRLDYCNGLFTVLSAKDKKKLESIQNRAARLVFATGRRSHAMPLLTELHWLPLPYHIDFKICLIVFKL